MSPRQLMLSNLLSRFLLLLRLYFKQAGVLKVELVKIFSLIPSLIFLELDLSNIPSIDIFSFGGKYWKASFDWFSGGLFVFV